MLTFSESRVDLAAEFRANPFGQHSPDLQYLLNLMRRPGTGAYHVLRVVKPGRRWELALTTPGVNRAPAPMGVFFDDLEDAERYVFDLRWSVLAAEARQRQ